MVVLSSSYTNSVNETLERGFDTWLGSVVDEEVARRDRAFVLVRELADRVEGRQIARRHDELGFAPSLEQ